MSCGFGYDSAETATTLALSRPGDLGESDGAFRLTPTGCEVEGVPNLDQFGEAFQACGQLANGLKWALGDLIIYGEGRGDWGEMYSQFIELTGRSYSQIQQAAHVSKVFPQGPARELADRVSWSHFYVVSRLPEEVAKTLLGEALDHDWPVTTLREGINDYKASIAPPAEPDASVEPPPPEMETVSFEVRSASVPVMVQCVNDTSASALSQWCKQFPDEYTFAWETRG
jgi:hypothetical protein